MFHEIDPDTVVQVCRVILRLLPDLVSATSQLRKSCKDRGAQQPDSVHPLPQAVIAPVAPCRPSRRASRRRNRRRR